MFVSGKRVRHGGSYTSDMTITRGAVSMIACDDRRGHIVAHKSRNTTHSVLAVSDQG